MSASAPNVVTARCAVDQATPNRLREVSDRGHEVERLEQLPQLLPRTLDPEPAMHVEAELRSHGVQVHTSTPARAVEHVDGQLRVHGPSSTQHWTFDLLLVVTGVQPDSDVAAKAGVRLGVHRAIAADQRMRTSVPDVWAAGDCAEAYHRLLERKTYMPLGTTAHKQGRVAAENALGGDRRFTGSWARKSSWSSI